MTARHPRGDCGQVTVLVALLVVPLLGISGLVIDVGYAYFTQRTLRAQADAAALAGAQRLPDAGATVVQAKQYASRPAAKNYQARLGTVTETVATKCLRSVPGCDTANAVVVDETAHVSSRQSRPTKRFSRSPPTPRRSTTSRPRGN